MEWLEQNASVLVPSGFIHVIYMSSTVFHYFVVKLYIAMVMGFMGFKHVVDII